MIRRSFLLALQLLLTQPASAYPVEIAWTTQYGQGIWWFDIYVGSDAMYMVDWFDPWELEIEIPDGNTPVWVTSTNPYGESDRSNILFYRVDGRGADTSCDQWDLYEDGVIGGPDWMKFLEGWGTLYDGSDFGQFAFWWGQSCD